MSSQVLARKYRPQDFSSVMGQETTVRILKNALSQKRFHHAYLFTGPRGIGKTTLARILAKALNCEKGPAEEPCNQCSQCVEITEGRSLSVMEIDGASNTSVEDVRDLREKIRYLPPGGRYKIYIIDEVHMLSTAAFNALLKTLEEPPAHAMFLFATTDAQKIPATVLSRLIRLDLKPISRSVTAQQLKKIAIAEAVSISEDALYLVAREAQGGLRDALSLLDQIIAFSQGAIDLAAVEQVVGLSTKTFVRDLTEALLNHDPARALRASEDAFRAGIDGKRLAFDLLENFRDLLVARVVRDETLFHRPPEEIEELAKLAGILPAQDLDALFRILQKGVSEMARAAAPKILFDVLLLRLASFEGLTPIEDLLGKTGGTEPSRPQAPRMPSSPMSSTPAPGVPRVEAAIQKTEPQATTKDWPGFLTSLRSRSSRLAALVEQGTLLSLSDQAVKLQFPAKASMTVELLEEPDRRMILHETMKEYFGKTLDFQCATASVQSIAAADLNDPNDPLHDAISVFKPKDVVRASRGSS